MPELPEVETTRRGLAPHVEGQELAAVRFGRGDLRYPLPEALRHQTGQRLLSLARRGKYLLFELERGTVIVHLGMSGSLRLVPPNTPPGKHEHVDLVFGNQAVRLRDPRRFGAVLWHEGDPLLHPLLVSLGMEPLDAGFSGNWLYHHTRHRHLTIKQLLMDNRTLVGVGNIYAAESLFLARIDPRRPAQSLRRADCQRLVEALVQTLEAALQAGGSSLRDFIGSDGQAGYFQMQHHVYGRAGQACRRCGGTVLSIVQGQRSSFFCAACQK